MPLIEIKKIWTPLELLTIQIYIDTDRKMYYKVGKNRLRRLGR